MGVSRIHLTKVLDGERRSPALLEKYLDLLRREKEEAKKKAMINPPIKKIVLGDFTVEIRLLSPAAAAQFAEEHVHETEAIAKRYRGLHRKLLEFGADFKLCDFLIRHSTNLSAARFRKINTSQGFLIADQCMEVNAPQLTELIKSRQSQSEKPADPGEPHAPETQ